MGNKYLEYNKILIVGGHGLGDCLLAFQCSHILKVKGYTNVDVAISTRDEIFNALSCLFGEEVIMKLPESASSEHQIEKGTSEEFNKLLPNYDKVYYVIPDLLFNNPRAFDFVKYGTNPQVIKQQRLLLHKSSPQKRIYCGLQTVTPGYLYQDIPKLLVELAKALPEYEIYFPNLKNWANQEAFYIEDKSKFPSNVVIDDNSTLISSLNLISESCYFIGTDNGPSHIAYHFGIPRLIIDPQFNNLPWVARWKEDNSDSIPFNCQPSGIAELVSKNIRIPQTLMVPRICLAMSPGADWTKKLIIKTI